MLKVKLQYFGHLMQRTDSLEKTLMLGKIEGRRRRGLTEDEMVGWHHDSMDMSLSKLQELVKDPYFELSRVKQGVFGLATTLYGITFVENKEIPVYHEDVTAYDVIGRAHV